MHTHSNLHNIMLINIQTKIDGVKLSLKIILPPDHCNIYIYLFNLILIHNINFYMN